MTKKRKSGGRSKGRKGRSGAVQCSLCGKRVPIDKAKKRTRFRSLADPSISRELRKAGTRMQRVQTFEYLCVNCSVHTGHARIRAKKDRKGED